MDASEREGFCDTVSGKAASSGRPDGPVSASADCCARVRESAGLTSREDGAELGASSETRVCLSWDLMAVESGLGPSNSRSGDRRSQDTSDGAGWERAEIGTGRWPGLTWPG